MARFVASFFGSGLLLRTLRRPDAGSGTVAGVFALVLALAVASKGVWWSIGLVAALIVTSLVSVAQLDIGQDDPAWVVIDEAAGTALAVVGLGPVFAVVAFVVFRIADINKTWFPGVDRAERTLPGTWGITADDLVAALYGLATGWLLQSLLG